MPLNPRSRLALTSVDLPAAANALAGFSRHPDGKDAEFSLFVFPVDGSAPEHPIADITEHFHLVSWSPDGKLIGMEKAAGSQQEYGIWMVPLLGGKPYRFLDQQRGRQLKPTFSPDGRLLAYVSTGQVYITRFPGPGESVQVSTERGFRSCMVARRP